MKSIITLFAVVAIGSSAGACSSGPSPEECEKAADHVVNLTVTEITKGQPDAPPAAIEAARAAAGKTRAKFVETCAGVPKSVIECVTQAGDLAAMQECRPK